ncbi:short chain dehydrogenase, partial [Burkholderia pseudomallei]
MHGAARSRCANPKPSDGGTAFNPFRSGNHTMQASFNDQRVLVIGGSSGIGAAAAHAFAVLDADVTIASRNANKLA